MVHRETRTIAWYHQFSQENILRGNHFRRRQCLSQWDSLQRHEYSWVPCPLVLVDPSLPATLTLVLIVNSAIDFAKLKHVFWDGQNGAKLHQEQ